MPQKSANTNLSNPKSLQFHQILKREGQPPQTPQSNQRVLILSTPIKLKDGTVNMEQRTIPLRIDNSQLTITATENKNKIISLKRSIEPLPLALPINKLNTKSPTVVKNEVGQVMGKLIPLGKFSNITRKTLLPAKTVPSPVTPTIGNNEIIKLGVAKARENKVLKLEEGELAEDLISRERKIISYSASEKKGNSTETTASSASSQKIGKSTNQLITVTDAKPKKRVHLVLKGYKNIASIGQTGTKIKLIPLDHWKAAATSNVTKTQKGVAMFVQPKIVDVRSCALDEIDKSENTNFGINKSNFNYVKEDFDVSNILEKDPLDLGEMLTEETETITDSLEKNLLNNDVNLKKEPESDKQAHGINKPDTIRTISEPGRVNSSKILTLAKGGMNVELRYDSKIEKQSIWPKKTHVLLKNSTEETISSDTILDTAKKLQPVIDSPIDKSEEETASLKNDVDHNELCIRFGIKKANATPTETAMLSYICDLKKKLHQSQMSRVQALTALQPREYVGSNTLSYIQRRFVETQLRNSGKMKKTQRFMKTDLVMAKDILKATGPRGYSNLRKLFSLPDMGAVINGISKT